MTFTIRTTAACARSRPPEGPNIGLIGSLALYARVNEYGFIEAPFRRVENGVATDQIDWMTADEEEKHVIAPANTPLDPKTNEFITTDAEGKIVRPHTVIARTRDFDGPSAPPPTCPSRTSTTWTSRRVRCSPSQPR